jgi:hypothetical protein
MKSSKLLILYLVAALIPFSASASSTASLSLSESVSASVEGVSKGSSAAVKVVAGDYKVTDIAEVTDHAEKVRIALQAVETNRENFYLYMSHDEFAEAHLSAGQVVTALKRPYGVSFKHVDATEAFVVVLDDAWIKDLRSNIVSG